MPIGRRDPWSPGSAQLPATTGRSADRAQADPLTTAVWPGRALAVTVFFAGLWALFTIVAGPAGAADDQAGDPLPPDPSPVATAPVATFPDGTPVEPAEISSPQPTSTSQEPAPDAPEATGDPDGSQEASSSTATAESLPAGTPDSSSSPTPAEPVAPVSGTDSPPVDDAADEDADSTGDPEASTGDQETVTTAGGSDTGTTDDGDADTTDTGTGTTDTGTGTTDTGTGTTDTGTTDTGTTDTGTTDTGTGTTHDTDTTYDSDSDGDSTSVDGTETPSGGEPESTEGEQPADTPLQHDVDVIDPALVPETDIGVVAPESTDPATAGGSGCAAPTQPADGASTGSTVSPESVVTPEPAVSPEPAVCDPATSVAVVPVEVIPAEPVAPMPPAETALVAEISAPDVGPLLPTVDEGEARTASRVAVPTRRHAYEPSRGTTIAPPPETPPAVTDSGPPPIWPASPAPPTVPMVPVAPVSPSTATSSGTTASGTGQHHESYGDLAILHAGPAIVFGQVGGASTSSLAGHVIGGADDPGSTPA